MTKMKVSATTPIGKRVSEILNLARNEEKEIALSSIGPKATNQAVKTCARALEALRDEGKECSLDAAIGTLKMEDGRTAHNIILTINIT